MLKIDVDFLCKVTFDFTAKLLLFPQTNNYPPSITVYQALNTKWLRDGKAFVVSLHRTPLRRFLCEIDYSADYCLIRSMFDERPSARVTVATYPPRGSMPTLIAVGVPTTMRND